MNLPRSALAVGFVFWLAGTALLIPMGHRLFGPDNALPAFAWSLLIVAATFFGIRAIARRVFARRRNISIADGALFGAFACLPGLILDAATYAAGRGTYPGLNASASGSMTITLFLAYAAALAAALNAARSLQSQPM